MSGGVPKDPFARAAQEQARRIAEHAEVRKTKRYEDAQTHLRRLAQDFVVILRLSWVAFTRYPSSRYWLLQNATDDLLESAVALPGLCDKGIFNVARRELRYALEATTKYVYIDQQVRGDAPLEERLTLLADHSKVPRSSIAPVDQIRFRLLADPSRCAMRSSRPSVP